jgi:phosphoribosyl-ATP pyrophosphohydrolase/phosphoribosyl-AMP cyclohydrolase/histidinol dehydrogenase
LLRITTAGEIVRGRGGAVTEAARQVAAEIVEDVRARGVVALREHAERFGEVGAGEELVLRRGALRNALDALDAADRGRLERIAARVRRFAEAQRAALAEVSIALPGGRAGDELLPVERAGCYAPGGRHPLPSSVLMTVIPARVAGVGEVWVASPRPAPITLAAAAVAGADAVVAAGGAQAVAALAFGAGDVPACDLVVGPGNAYVTAAKQLVSHRVGIDMLAGPSELVVLADASADPALVAADLLAQAEHDDDALPVLVAVGERVVKEVERELAAQIETLPTRNTARRALVNGGAIIAGNLDAAIASCDELAPEHLALHVADAERVARRVRHCGAVFVGAGAAEVLADYGAGPNHVLPTGATARFSAGLSVSTFLRRRTWLRVDDPASARELVEDAAWLARLEGLEAHARAAERRGPARVE